MAYTTINKSTDYFNTVLYSNAGDGAKAVTGVGFQPDLVWLKNRTVAYNAQFHDAVRGASNGSLYTNTTAAVDTGYPISSFDSDGFTTGSQSSNASQNSASQVAWNWKAGTGAGSSNTDGSINTASTSVNTTSGFSISKYTGTGIAGATIGHGLGVKPSMIIVKGITYAEEWEIYHKSLGATKTIKLNNTVASSTTSSRWNDTEPTSSVFTVGNADATNKSGYDYIAYCFAEKTGYSKFGFYTGNGNADGTFVYTGFKPAFLMIKQENTTGNWALSDNKRNNTGGGNFVSHTLAANLNNNESHFGGGSGNKQDYLSNGFKIRDTGGYANTNGGTYLYMAFAEAPLVGSNNIPCTAR